MATYFWVGGTGTWSGTGNTQFALTSGGLATISNPTNADTVNFDANSGTAATVTVTATAVSLSTTVTTTDINLSLSGSPTLCTSAGILTLTSGTLTLSTFTLTVGRFASSNSNARVIAFGTGNITCTGVGAAWSTATATNLTTTGTPVVNVTSALSTTITVSAGAISEANSISFNFTAGTYVLSFLNISNYAAKNVNFTGFAGTWNATGNNATVYGDLTLNSSMTLSTSTGNFVFGSTSATPRAITFAGQTMDFPPNFNGVGGTWALQDTMTLGPTRTMTLTNGTVKLKAGTTNTVGGFATSSTTRKFLQSTTASTQATLSQASGTVNATYLTIQDINATGGATWNAFTTSGNVDGGDNTGWNFGGTPDVDTEIGYRLRSFTQTRRF